MRALRTQRAGISAAGHVAHTQLKCGARVITERVPGARSVAVGLVISSGSRDDGVEHQGISHFIEHMVFKGTQRRRAHHIAQRLESVGGYLNAFTEKEVTCYFGRALPEHVGRAIDAVVDLALNARFPEEDIEREQNVVLEEIKLYEDTPEEAALDLYDSLIYAEHGLGQPVLGTRQTVTALTRAELVAHVKAHYRPEQMVLAVVGDVSHQQAVKTAEKVFAGMQSKGEPGTDRRTPPSLEARSVKQHKPVQQAHLVLGTRAPSLTDADRHVAVLLNTALGGGMSSRLNQRIREREGSCYALYSFLNTHTDVGDLGIYAGVEVGQLPRTEKLIRREMQWFAEHELSDRVLSRIKKQARGELLLGLESLSNRMLYIARHMLYHADAPSVEAEVEALEAVTSADIQRLAARLFVEQPVVTALLCPTDS